MICIKLHFALTFCLLLTINCHQKKFKIEEKKIKANQNNREITLLMPAIAVKKYYKVLLRYKEQACSNFTLVKLSSSMVKVQYPIKPIDESLGHWMDSDTNSDIYALKEYLELFVDKWQSANRRTLVLFNWYVNIPKGIVDILLKLQNEQNVDVILVSPIPRLLELEQFPRHRKFLTIFDKDFKHALMDANHLIDVIKNPDFNRFEFENALPNSKDRHCLENVKVFPIFSKTHRCFCDFINTVKFIVLMKDYNKKILITPLEDIATLTNWHSSNSYYEYYKLDFNKATFIDLIKSGVLQGPKKKVFLLFFKVSIFHSTVPDKRIARLQRLLRYGNQTIRIFFIYQDRFGNFIFREENDIRRYDLRTKDGLEFMMDQLVEAGCK